MKKEIKLILSIFGVILLFFAYKSQKTENIVAVDTVFAEKTSIINQIVANGNIEEQNKSYISINQNGIVENIFFSVGDSVKKGDVVLTIKTNDLQLNQSVNSVIDLIGNKNITILDTKNSGEIEIISNVNGVITSIPSVSNESIVSGVPFLSICDQDNLIARVSISEKNIKEAKVGQSVLMTGDSFNGFIHGKITQIMPYTTTNLDILSGNNTVLVEAIIEFENYKKDIIVGCSIEAKITIDEKINAITVPFYAIFQENTQEYVYILENNVVFKQEITTGYEVFDKIEVLSGLEGDEILVVSENVFEGQVVTHEQ